MGWSERMADALIGNRRPRMWERAAGIPEQRAHEERRQRQEIRDKAARGESDPFMRDLRDYGGPSTYVPAPNIVRRQTDLERTSIEGRAAMDSIRDEFTPDEGIGAHLPNVSTDHPGLTDKSG